MPPCRRPALHRTFFPLVVVSRCAPPDVADVVLKVSNSCAACLVYLECGGKRSATPLSIWCTRHSGTRSERRRAGNPKRLAAVHPPQCCYGGRALCRRTPKLLCWHRCCSVCKPEWELEFGQSRFPLSVCTRIELRPASAEFSFMTSQGREQAAAAGRPKSWTHR